MAWRTVVTIRNSSTGAPVTGQTVQLYDGDGGGGSSLQGSFTDNGDGTYYLVMTSIGSLIGTIKINGVVQSEKKQVGFVGEDVIDHLLLESFGGAGVANSVHGLQAGDGDFVGEDKTQTLTNKTLDASCAIPAGAITSGTLALARIPTSIPDSKLAQLTTTDKVAGSAVELGTNPGLTDSSGLVVLPNPTTPTIENTSTGIRVKLSATTPGLKRAADGLAVDATTIPKLTTADTVAWSAIDVTWGAPHHFDAGDDPGTAIEALDDALYQFRVDRETPDTKLLMVYVQSHEVARNSPTAEADAVTNAAQYFDGDNTKRRKICVPFMKSPELMYLVLRGQFNNTGAYVTTVDAEIRDDAGTLQLTFQQAETGTTWTTLNAQAFTGEIASGFLWLVVYLTSGNAAGTAQLRNVNAFLSNSSFITGEENLDPAFWTPAAEQFA